MKQFFIRENGEFSEEEMDRYVSGVRVCEDRFGWRLNLNPDARGELDDAGSPVYFKKIKVAPDDERACFKKRPQWSKSNRYAGKCGFSFKTKERQGGRALWQPFRAVRHLQLQFCNYFFCLCGQAFPPK